ncbi:centrosomal protein 20 [Nomia melanderi]|uniref:centrosomal protein 20 n=1 Tax=Nomia melanderi TaxID=2448451 RepID=UPI0013045F21|nr:lisH domain-containing protein FOPNL [Nomia melanderi]
MATEKDLINAVRESLVRTGELSRMKAEMHTKIIQILDNSNSGNKQKLPIPPQDITLLNELIRNYLDWMGYKYSSTVFISECNLPKQPPDRFLITQSLRVTEDDNGRELPLLCSILETIKNIRST